MGLFCLHDAQGPMRFMTRTRIQCLWRGLVPSALLLTAMSFQPAMAMSLIQEGRRDAVLDCSSCHRVTKDQNPPPPVFDPDEARNLVAPSFDIIAREYRGKPTRLMNIIQAPRHPMREQQFLPHDLRAIVRYIGSLQNERW